MSKQTINWNGTKRVCEYKTPLARNVRIGDLLTTKEGLAEVVTVQRDCESINKYGKTYVAILATLRDGRMIFDNTSGRKTVFRSRA